MIHFTEINQAPPPTQYFSILERIAALKLVPRNCLRYLKTILIIGGGGLASKFR